MSIGTLESRTSHLAAVVGRIRLSFVATVLAAGLLLACAVALAWVVGGVILDLALPLSVPGRIAVWCGWWAAVTAACVAFLCVPAWRRPIIESMALKIERALGGIHNRLLTVVDLARRDRPQEGFRTSDGRDFRPELVERLLDQTQERMQGFRVSQVVPWRAVLRNLAIAAGVAVVIAALFLSLGERFVITLQRLLDPTADIPPATWLQLRTPGDLDVLEGEPFEIEGRVVRSTVDEVDLVLYDAAGRASRQPMRGVETGLFTAALEGLDKPTRYRLEAGNTWTKTHDIRILKRPEIRSLSRRVRLPEYMRIATPIPVEPEATQIKAPVGGTVEFEAVASAEAAEGSLKLFERSLENRVVERFDERVWFEDDLPRDAFSETPWKWTTAHAAGGLRSFTFPGDGRPLVMRTRLEPLVLPRDRLESRAVMVMARIDAAAAPTWLSLVLDHQSGRTELVWGDVGKAPPIAGAARVAAGPLPAPGAWTRLTVPMKSLAHLAGQPVTGATFASDRGRMLLDRPGWVERTEETVKQPVDTPTGEIALTRIAATAPAPEPSAVAAAQDAAWLGGLPVATPTWATIEFRSRHGHANLPVPPVEIVPTIDRPPSIVVDKVPETLTLKVADDVPVRGRGFDDWGIDDVSVLIGPDADHLAEPVPLPGVSLTHSPPPTQLPFATALTPEMLGIGPGKSAAWKLRIRDTKGQFAETKVFRITVVMPPESELAKTQVPALAQAKKEAEQVAKEAEKKADPLDAKQAEVQEALAKDKTPEKKTVDELAQKLDQEHRLAEQLAKSVEKAAEQAAKSDLVPEAQKEKLAELAADAKKLEAQLAGEKQPPEPASAKPDAPPQPAAAEQPKQTTAEKAAEEKAERVAEAPKQQAVSEAAKELARELEAVEQRLNAQGAALQLEALAKDLEQRAEQLADQSTSPAQTPAEKQQTKEQIRDVEQILGQRFPEPKPTPKPTAKPTPKPAAAQNPNPDTKAAETATAKPEPQAAATANAKPASPPPSDTKAPDTPPSPQLASNPEPVPAAEQPANPEVTPAPEPATAAEAAAQAASETAQVTAELAKQLAGKAAIPTAEEPNSSPPNAATSPEPTQPSTAAQSSPAAKQSPASQPAEQSPAPTPSPPAAAQAKADDPTAGDPPPDGSPSSAADIQALLDSKDVQQALAMAERAQRLQERAAAAAAAAARADAAREQAENQQPPGDEPGDQQGQGPGGKGRRGDEVASTEEKTKPQGRSEGGAQTGRTDLEAAELLRGLDAKQRAALYKLPPRIRDPLLEGMRQRGPAAYQNVIDTYFRQLGKDIPQ